MSLEMMKEKIFRFFDIQSQRLFHFVADDSNE